MFGQHSLKDIIVKWVKDQKKDHHFSVLGFRNDGNPPHLIWKIDHVIFVNMLITCVKVKLYNVLSASNYTRELVPSMT